MGRCMFKFAQLLVQGILCVELQVSSIKALREPAIDRCQEVSGFGALALLLPQACQAHGGPQLPGCGLLLAGHGPRLLEAGFRLLPWGPWALPQEQRAP